MWGSEVEDTTGSGNGLRAEVVGGRGGVSAKRMSGRCPWGGRGGGGGSGGGG